MYGTVAREESVELNEHSDRRVIVIATYHRVNSVAYLFKTYGKISFVGLNTFTYDKTHILLAMFGL